MLELSLVDGVINRRRGLNKDLDLQLENLGEAAKASLIVFIGQNPLYISKSMVSILRKIVVSDDTNFAIWANSFKESPVYNSIQSLRSLKNSNDVCCNAIIEMHTVFSGRCIQLASDYASQTKQRVLLFSQQNQSATSVDTTVSAKLIELAKKNEDANQMFERVSAFCYENRI